MRGRLEQLGVPGVRCATFHAAALGQLRFFAAEQPGRILASKVLPLRYIANSLPRPYRFRPAADLATEVEWAKNRRITPADYLSSLGEHRPPIPEDLMLRVYTEYERRKERDGWVDFEDLLELTIQLFDGDAGALEQVRGRYQAFTVDEYQDVNLLQQTLLDRWLGERDELCAVGDDYQSIYAFTGASPEHLLAMPKRFPHATVVRLEENYRSTPEILGFANRLVPKLGGAEKVLRATLAPGPEPTTRSFGEPYVEAAFLVERIRELHESGVPYEEMAILFRTNARSADYEEALSEAEIPSQGAALLSREGAKQFLKALRGRPLVGRAARRPRPGAAREAPRPARRAGSHAPERPRAARQARGGVRGRRRRVRRAPRGTLRPQRRPWRPPPHLPPRERARVRGGLPPAPRGEGAAVEALEDARRRGRGAAPPLRRPHAREAPPERHVVGQAEPVPRRARPQSGRAEARRAGRSALRDAQALAARDREGRGEARVRHLPQLDAGRDRPTLAADEGGAGDGPGRWARPSSSATARPCSPR